MLEEFDFDVSKVQTLELELLLDSFITQSLWLVERFEPSILIIILLLSVLSFKNCDPVALAFPSSPHDVAANIGTDKISADPNPSNNFLFIISP